MPVQYRHMLIAYFKVDTRCIIKNRKQREEIQCEESFNKVVEVMLGPLPVDRGDIG